MRERNFRAVYLAGLWSRSGSSLAGVAVVWIVFASTGSALDVAYVAVVELAASILFSLPSGVWVDRYDRASLMVVADVTRAGVMAALGLSLLVFGFQLPVILTAMFSVAAASMLFQPAEQTILPRIVPAGRLADANGLNRSSRAIVGMVGSSLGGALVIIVGAALGVLYNSITFVVSALFLFTVYTALRQAGRKGTPSGVVRERHMGREIVEGLRWLIHEAPGLWELSVSALFFNFFVTLYGTFVVIFVVEVLHGTALIYGLFLAASTAGMALGSLLVGRTRTVRSAGRVWVIGYGIGGGLGLLALSQVTSPLLAFPIVFAYEVSLGIAGNTWLTAAQILVPSHVQGRYFALDGLLSWGVLPVAQITGALLIVAKGIDFTILVSGAGLLASGLLSMLGRNLWHLGVTGTPQT